MRCILFGCHIFTHTCFAHTLHFALPFCRHFACTGKNYLKAHTQDSAHTPSCLQPVKNTCAHHNTPYHACLLPFPMASWFILPCSPSAGIYHGHGHQLGMRALPQSQPALALAWTWPSWVEMELENPGPPSLPPALPSHAMKSSPPPRHHLNEIMASSGTPQLHVLLDLLPFYPTPC